MLTQTLDRDLQRLQAEILVLGDIVEKAIGESVERLKWPDLRHLQQRNAFNHQVTKKRFAIETECLLLTATRQPVAEDMRTIISVLEIAIELECIEYFVRDIAKAPFMSNGETPSNALVHLHRMATKTRGRLRRALETFTCRDSALARAMPIKDDEVSTLHQQVCQILQLFMKSNSPAVANQTKSLWRVIHNLERISDRVASICGWVAFAATGKMTKGRLTEDGCNFG